MKLGSSTPTNIALVNSASETKYVSGSSLTTYVPYPYSYSGGFHGYNPHSAYGGFGGYYTYAVSTISSPGYYTTNNKYFLEAKMFDLKTEELLFSVQTEAKNPEGIEKSGKEYTQTLMDEIKRLELQKK